MARDHGDQEPGWELELAARLAAGEAVPDARFDRLFGPDLQRLAHLHFTPVAAARRAAAWLTAGGAAEVCDLGSGAGKLCLVGAACTPARFTGVELRPGLVEVARRAARRLGLDRARFTVGDLREVPLDGYQGLHVYDPFAEVEADEDERLDPFVPTRDRAADAEALAARLATARPGTRLTLFCALVEPELAGWERVDALTLDARGDVLGCWIRR